MQVNIHLLLDLTVAASDQQSTSEFLQTLMSRDVLGGIIHNATVLLPPHVSAAKIVPVTGWLFKSGDDFLSEAKLATQFAGDSGCHLLILLGPVMAGSEAVGALVQTLSIDPHFGVSVPRQFNPESGEILKIAPELGDPELTTLPRRVLAEIPDYYILPELLSSCVLIRDVVVCNLPLPDANYETLAGAVQHYLCHVRRAGFRTVVNNHVAIPAFSQSGERSLLVSDADTRRLHTEHPDTGKAKTEIAEHSLHLHESLLGRLFSTKTDVSKTLLLDIRGVPAFTNGTAEAALALCDALKQTKTDWNISLLAEAASVEHHKLGERYAPWPILTKHGGQYFTAALRPSQPWHISTMIELHRMALLNFYAMLDTISWDILFEAPRGLGAFWEFMSQYADGLLYNSFDTRNHVNCRFPLTESKPQYVFHHSFHPDDYTVESFLDLSSPGDYIFVIGNEYDHKHLAPTVDLLSSAFPLQQIKVLGLKSHSNSRVHVLESGRIPVADVDALFARASLIVFPSLYEGFGLPVLKGLSYGRTVIARRSALLLEIAGNYRGPGKLVAYSTPADLVDAVGRLTHGCPVSELVLGTALKEGQTPKTWGDVAVGVLDFIEEQMSRPNHREWTARERAIRQLNAFGT